MVAILGRFVKQPDEILDYDVDYSDWFSNRVDTPTSYSVVVEDGIDLVDDGLSGTTVRVVLSGGVHGARYKVTVLLTTSAGISKEADFVVTVREV